MIIYNLTDFYLGVLTGVAGLGIVVGFAAVLVAFAGTESDAYKRGLSGRHRPGALAGGELPATHSATLPVVAPQKDPAKPGKSTAARVSSHPRPRRKRRTHSLPKV